MRNTKIAIMLLAVGLMAIPAFAAADLNLVCDPVSSCTSGGISIITNTLNPTFDMVINGGNVNPGTYEGFLGILVPGGPASFTVNTGSEESGEASPTSFTTGKLTTVLGETTGNIYEFSSLASASAQVIATPTSFDVYEWDLGSTTTTTGTIFSGITATGLPKGTVIVGWLENTSDDTITLRTPLSESLTVAPEPRYTSALLGLGLLAGILVMRRRRTA